MNNKTLFELDVCLTDLRKSHELLSGFSHHINKSIESLEEAVFSSRNDPNYDFSKALNEYETVIRSYRVLKNQLVSLSKTVLELNGYEIANK